MRENVVDHAARSAQARRNPLTIVTIAAAHHLPGDLRQLVSGHTQASAAGDRQSGPRPIRAAYGGKTASARSGAEDCHAVLYSATPAPRSHEVRNGTYKAAVRHPAGLHQECALRAGSREIGVFTDNVDTVSSATSRALLDQATAATRSPRSTSLRASRNSIKSCLRPASSSPPSITIAH